MAAEYEFEKLEVYQEGMDLAEKIYQVTQQFPTGEQFGMIGQMRRAAVSGGRSWQIWISRTVVRGHGSGGG
jgi:hypothetical protein